MGSGRKGLEMGSQTGRRGGRGSKRSEVPAAWLTRAEAAEALGMTRSGVRKLDGRGLTPRAWGGAIYYDPEQVEKLRQERSGEFVSQAFEIFRNGGDPVEVVIQTGMAPTMAENLWRGYLNLRVSARNVVLIEFPDAIHAEAWRTTFSADLLSPAAVKIALEAAAMDPVTRRRIRQLVDESGTQRVTDRSTKKKPPNPGG